MSILTQKTTLMDVEPTKVSADTPKTQPRKRGGTQLQHIPMAGNF